MTPSEPSLCGRFGPPELESSPLRVRREKGTPRPRRRVRKRRLAALLLVLFVAAALSFTFGLVRAVASEVPALDPAAQHCGRGHRRLRVQRQDGARRAPRRREPRPRRHRGHRADHAAGDRLGRGPALLRAQRHRRARSRARALAGRSPAGHRRGRLDDHAAVREERVHPQRADARAEGSRGRARVAARAALEQGPDPHRVPQHDLLRARGVRDPASGPRVLQEEREGPHARRLGAPRRDSLRSVALRPGDQPAERDASTAPRPPDDVRPGEDLAEPVPARGQGSSPRPRRHPATGHPGAGAVLRQLRQGRPRRALRRRSRVRRRAQGDDDDRPRPPAESSRGDRERPAQSRRACGRARRDRSSRRRREGDVRRAELPAEPVQPRRAGETAAGLVVQADRARDGDERGHLAGHRARVEAGLDRRRRPDLEGDQLRPHLSRSREPLARDRVLGQLGVCAAHRPRRAEGDREDGARASGSAAGSRRTSRSASARAP